MKWSLSNLEMNLMCEVNRQWRYNFKSQNYAQWLILGYSVQSNNILATQIYVTLIFTFMNPILWLTWVVSYSVGSLATMMAYLEEATRLHSSWPAELSIKGHGYNIHDVTTHTGIPYMCRVNIIHEVTKNEYSHTTLINWLVEMLRRRVSFPVSAWTSWRIYTGRRWMPNCFLVLLVFVAFLFNRQVSPGSWCTVGRPTSSIQVSTWKSCVKKMRTLFRESPVNKNMLTLLNLLKSNRKAFILLTTRMTIC